MGNRTRAVLGVAGAVLAAAGCQHGGASRPYTAARPAYDAATAGGRPLRLGGYAGYQYGPARGRARDTMPLGVEAPLP